MMVVYDYERIVPPFMQTLIQLGSRRFDEIIYITPPIPDYYARTIRIPNVRIVTWTGWQRMVQYVKGVCSPLRPQFWKELCKGPISLGAIKNIGQKFFCSDGFLAMSLPFIRRALAANAEVYLMGTWMGVDAFTAARVKKRYSEVFACALAHSGEVMAKRNPYIFQDFHEYEHTYLNHTYFISSIVMNDYLNVMEKCHIRERFGNRISTQYLGCTKPNQRLNPWTLADSLHIVSCSRMDANKRLGLIISALKKWTNGNIKWTHIGTGVLEHDIRLQAEELAEANPLVQIEFLGRLDNSDVIYYYETVAVDLFVNVSKSEGLPISIMEAMSYGIPSIATDVGGSSEIVNSQNGFLLRENFTDNELIAAIATYKQMDCNQLSQMRSCAYCTWFEKFDATKNAMNLYDSWTIIK